MTKTKCWNCGETFEFDANDTRPYVYHSCVDKDTGKQTMHAHSNPNLIRSFPVFVPKPSRKKTRSMTRKEKV
jgi:hypothetical protein